MSRSIASRIGGHAFRYLTARVRAGRLVSTFQHGLNVLFDEENEPGFVSLQTADAPLHPWAVRTHSLPGVSENEPVVAESQQVRFRGGSALDLSSAALDELRIAPYTLREADRAMSQLPRLKQLLEEERAKREPDPFQPRIDVILGRWRTTGDPKTLLDLVGLGSGSTPSGDDILVGMLAGFTAFEAVSDQAKENLTGLRVDLHQAQTLSTHLASAQMVAAAAGGAFPERLCELANRLRAVHVSCVHCLARKVLVQGAMSGFSALSGFAAAGSLSRRDS